MKKGAGGRAKNDYQCHKKGPGRGKNLATGCKKGLVDQAIEMICKKGHGKNAYEKAPWEDVLKSNKALE